jgi:ribosomal protein S18 acetylase RimI-like enzyme
MNQFSTPLDRVTIRRARESDVSNIVELKSRLDKLHHLPGLWPPERGKRQDLVHYRKLLRQPVARLFVAEQSPHRLVGYLTAYIQIRKCDQKDFRRVGVIGEAFVERRHRKQGIGTALVDAAACFFSTKGIRHVTLRNAVGNDLANKFWGRLSFNAVLYTRTTTLGGLDRALRKPKPFQHLPPT